MGVQKKNAVCMSMTIKFNSFENHKHNYLLIGNTRLHWALRKNNSYEFLHSLFDQKVPENISLKKLIWASVGKYPTNKFSMKNEININDINFKNIPQNIGIDRVLAGFAARKMLKNNLKKNILIADLGTTVSITKFNYKGTMIGGQLLPGFTTQLKSMEQNTKNLKFPNNFSIPSKNFEIPTNNAMLRGVYNAIIGAILLSFNSKQDLLILCGGDANLIGNSIKSKISDFLIEPDLVMYGMIFLRN